MIDNKRYDLQLKIVDTLQEANFNGVAIAPTGLGKAFILIESLKRMKPKGRIWYLCDSELNRDETFKNELIKWGGEEFIDQIEFMCYQTAYKLEDEDIEVGLFDEFDFAVTPEYIKGISKNKFKHVVAVSATLTEDKKRLIETIVPVVYEVGLQEIEELGLLNKTKYYYVNFMLTPIENDAYLDYSRTFAKLLNDGKRNRWKLEMLKIQRGQFLASLESSRKICRKLLGELYEDMYSRIVVFCGLSKQADKICDYSYHSKSEENHLERFDRGEIRILSVVGKINRGVNINGINRIVFDAPTKSATRFLQRSGRGRRLRPDEVLEVYFLIPYYRNSKGKILPTIVHRWVKESTKSLDYEPVIYKFKQNEKIS